MKNIFNTSIARGLVFIPLLSVGLTACGGPKAEGHTYAGGGNRHGLRAAIGDESQGRTRHVPPLEDCFSTHRS